LKVALFFLGAENPYPGAGWTRVEFLAKTLAKRGYLVEVMGVFTLGKRRATVVNDDSIRISNIIPRLSSTMPFSIILNIIMSFITSLVVLLAKRPKIMVISLPGCHSDLGVMLASNLLRIKYVIDYRDEWEDYLINNTSSFVGRLIYRLIKKISTRLYKNALFVSCVTAGFAKNLREKRGIKNIILVPNGADTEILKPYDKKSMKTLAGLHNHFVIAYMGSLSVYHDLETFMKALKSLNLDIIRRIKLLILSPDQSAAQIKALVKKYGLEEIAHFFKAHIEKTKVARLLSAADIGLIAGLYSENQVPVRFYEYCACGLPVIAIIQERFFENSVLSKLILRSETGFVLSTSSIEEISKTIQSLLNNRELLEKTGKRARKLAKSEFDRHLFSEIFLKELDKRLHNKHES